MKADPDSWEQGSNFGRDHGERVASKTAGKWRALHWLWQNSTLPSVRACRRTTLPGEHALVSISRGSAAVSGLRTCSSVWACPICSQRVWAERRDQLSGILHAAEAERLSVFMVTLTVRHNRSQGLAPLLDGLTSAWKATQDSKAVQRQLRALDVVGIVRRAEATWGPTHGWHPHLHVYVVARESADASQLGDAMFQAWRTSLVASGFAAPIRDMGGLSVQALDLTHNLNAAAAYVTEDGAYSAEGGTKSEAACELTDSGGKRANGDNFTLWQLLDRAVEGDETARRLWHEWEAGTKRRRAWAVSSALHRLAETHPRPAPEDPGREPVGTIPDEGWDYLCRHRGGPGEMLALVERAYWTSRLCRAGPDDPEIRHARGLAAARDALGRYCEEAGIRIRRTTVSNMT